MTKGFTKVDNNILLNSSLSLEAKGLYSILKHLSTIPNFIIRRDYVKGISGYGETAFRRVWKELKEKGLLLEAKLREKGRYIYKYVLNTNEEIKKPKVPEEKQPPVGNAAGKRLDTKQEMSVTDLDIKIISKSTGFTDEQSKEILEAANNNTSKVMESYQYAKEQNDVRNIFKYTKWAVKNLANHVNIFSNKKKPSFNNFKQRTYDFKKLESALLHGKFYELPV
ncbi:hypothetical protein [Clostridium sp. 001]|uniref:hypothetical protein n=1 Tax=Clostridium sp. 001 TaxID=1970093 RepID=UPI001C2CBE16|nr:hypothetical protein [Clostridium sp. 001]QXE20466.1 hypothetical protein B5S50_17370 [Clostridium sp. 001]